MKKFKFMLAAIVAIMAIVSLNSCRQVASTAIESSISEINDGLPSLVDEGMTLDRVTVEGNDIVFHYTLDASIYDVDVLSSSPEAKESIIEALQEPSGDKEEEMGMEIFRQSGKDIVYKFTDTNGRTGNIRVYNSEY